MDNLFVGLFDTTGVVTISLTNFFICIISALILGIFMAMMYAYKTKCTQSFVITLAVLPVTVAMVIMMVNGNIGAGVAVAGAFSLVRFRSVPGTAKEIGAIFTAMCTGLTIGMGYIGFGFIFAIVACVFSFVLNAVSFGASSKALRTLQITIPENLNYTHAFDDIFTGFTSEASLITAKTSNMGSMFKLTYEIELKNEADEKDFIDELRCRNGNLEIMLTKRNTAENGL